MLHLIEKEKSIAILDLARTDRSNGQNDESCYKRHSRHQIGPKNTHDI